MKPERWSLVKDIVARARELEVDRRSSFVERRCDGDDDLAREVRQLLTTRPDDAFLNPPDASPAGEPPPQSDDFPKTLGEYELLEELGRGGMGRVYRAHDRTLRRDVAIKVLATAYALDERGRNRFLREASAAARLRHPSVVPVHRVVQTDESQYIVMALVAGHDLRREIEAQRAVVARGPAAAGDDADDGDGGERGPGRRLPILPAFGSARYVSAVAELCRQLASALAHAHEQGVIHRDVKPHNVLLRPDGTPMVVDFGLARDRSLEGLTRTGEIQGTPDYMSPEQHAGRADVDERTDVFSLGVVLYELLTLGLPFASLRQLSATRAGTELPPRPPRRAVPAIPRDLETICLHALEWRPADRYPSMAELEADLARFLGHRAIRARPPGRTELVLRHLQRRRRAYLGGLLIAAAIVTTFVVTRFRQQDAERRRQARSWQPFVEQPLDAFEPARLVRLRSDLERFLGSYPQGAEAEVARAEQRRLSAHARSLAEQGRARARDGIGDGEREPFSLETLLGGLAVLETASRLLPEDDALAASCRLESWYPRVELRFHGLGAASLDEVRAYRQSVGLVWAELGDPMPLPAGWREGPIRLPPGSHRLTFVLPEVGAAEVTRHLSRWDHIQPVDVWLRPDEDVLAGMVPIPEGETIVGFDYRPYPWMMRRAVSVAPFWIDVTEVTNAEYLEFVRVTRAPRPHHWGDEPYDAAWDDLPVVGVSQGDAQAYAEWRGKRLPTWVEWEAAARGPEGLTRPAGLEGLPIEELRALALVGRVPSRHESRWPGYFQHIRPVGSHPADRSPFGLLDVLGSVREWTESPFITSVDESIHAEVGVFTVKGMDWSTNAYLDLSNPSEYSHLSEDVGFRCVRVASRTMSERQHWESGGER